MTISFVFICSLLMVYFAYSSSFSSLSASLLVWVFLAGPVFPQHPGEVQMGCVCHGLGELSGMEPPRNLGCRDLWIQLSAHSGV